MSVGGRQALSFAFFKVTVVSAAKHSGYRPEPDRSPTVEGSRANRNRRWFEPKVKKRMRSWQCCRKEICALMTNLARQQMMPKANDLEGRQDLAGKLGGQAGMPKAGGFAIAP